MPDNALREKWLGTIRDNIKRHGFHIYIVQQGAYPRFAYTIGLTESHGAELVLPGAIFYDVDDLSEILHAFHRKWKGPKGSTKPLVLEGHGSFALHEADRTWVSRLLRGARDHYQRDITAFQIVPDDDHRTLDVPDMRVAYSPSSEPVWQCVEKPWPYEIPEDSTVITNLDALRGAPITEVCRWEDDYWEAFAGDGTETPEADTRVVSPLWLVASDPSLAPMLGLEVEKGIHRSARGAWKPWVRAT